MADVEDERAEEVLSELHAITTAKFEIDEDTGERRKVTTPNGPSNFAYPTRDRIASAKAFLEYTKKKPTQSNTLDVNAPEAFLEALAQKEAQKNGDESETTGDPRTSS